MSAFMVNNNVMAKVVTALELTESENGNVSFWLPYDECVLRGFAEIGGIKVTSPIQTYLDLMHDDGERVANGIWEKYVRDQWIPPTLADAA